MKSPFKFLDAYAPEDKEFFFGRETEIAELYSMVTKNRLILIYGQSGTGKTSLVQCGLAGCFDATDWYPIFIRRQNNINQSLEQRLLQASGGTEMSSMADALDDIYVTYLRPVYLIFDQLEELFVLGDPKEQRAFIDNIRAVLEANTPSRIIFIIREEYLAHLYDIERFIPNLFDRRLRVEPMNRAKVSEVLSGSFKRFNIAVEQPATERFEQIIGQVSSGKSGIQLPFLQVWLDRFYKEQYNKAYPGQELRGEWPLLEFSAKNIREFGGIEAVLDDFLREQTDSLDRELKTRFPEIEAHTARKVLDAFVSEEGTKRPVGYEWKGDALQVEARWLPLFKPLSPEILGVCCRRLEQARLLRFSEDYAELAHDALAALIDGQRSQQQRRLSEAYTRLLNNQREFRETGEYLSRRQLNSVEEYLPALKDRLDADLRAFVQESFVRAEKAEHVELEAERAKRRQARKVAVLGLTLAGVALVAFLVAFSQYRAAERAKTDIARNALDARLNIARTLKVQGEYTAAIQQLDAARPLAAELPASNLTELDQEQNRWRRVRHFVETGDSLSRTGDLRMALIQYDSARVADPDARIESLLVQTREKLEAKFADYMLRGNALVNARQYALAAGFYEKALQLKPEDATALAQLAVCKARR